MSLPPHPTPQTNNAASAATWSISHALERYAAAEASGQSALHGVTVRGHVTRVSDPPVGACFLQIADRAHVEVVIPGKRRHLLPKSLSTAQQVEVSGTLRRHRGSAPQIEVLSIRILADGGTSPIPEPRSAPAALPPVGTLGLVTGAGSAAYRDVLEVAQNRCPWLEIVFANSPVAGPDAAARMADAILQLNTCVRPPDAILLTRGGAITPQEFDPFGDSLLLAVIRASRIPLFVAIGHAGDVTPACRTAMAAFATPTFAAVSLLPDKMLIERELSELTQLLERGFSLWGRDVPRLAPTPVPIPAAAPLSRAELLNAALERLRHAGTRLNECSLTSPDLAYSAVADLCLARSILATPCPTVTPLT